MTKLMTEAICLILLNSDQPRPHVVLTAHSYHLLVENSDSSKAVNNIGENKVMKKHRQGQPILLIYKKHRTSAKIKLVRLELCSLSVPSLVPKRSQVYTLLPFDQARPLEL
jgi:hypothetical protein